MVLPARLELTLCADCAQPIEWYPPRNRWATKIADTGDLDAWSFTCRVIRVNGIIVAADYHHPPNEPQHHYRPTQRYTSPTWPDDTSPSP